MGLPNCLSRHFRLWTLWGPTVWVKLRQDQNPSSEYSVFQLFQPMLDTSPMFWDLVFTGKVEREINFNFLAKYLSRFAGDLPKKIEVEDPSHFIQCRRTTFRISQTRYVTTLLRLQTRRGYECNISLTLKQCLRALIAGVPSAHRPEVQSQSTFSPQGSARGWSLSHQYLH